MINEGTAPKKGRQPSNEEIIDVVRRYSYKEITAVQAIELLGISTTEFYKCVKLYEPHDTLRRRGRYDVRALDKLIAQHALGQIRVKDAAKTLGISHSAFVQQAKARWPSWADDYRTARSARYNFAESDAEIIYQCLTKRIKRKEAAQKLGISNCTMSTHIKELHTAGLEELPDDHENAINEIRRAIKTVAQAHRPPKRGLDSLTGEQRDILNRYCKKEINLDKTAILLGVSVGTVYRWRKIVEQDAKGQG